MLETLWRDLDGFQRINPSDVNIAQFALVSETVPYHELDKQARRLMATLQQAQEYSVIADSGKIGLCGETKEELAQRAGKIRQMVREHQAERRAALKELQNEL
mgnify:CR=1 FL=1